MKANKKQDQQQDQKPNLKLNSIKVKELTLDDLASVVGGGGEDVKNKNEG